ncbi:Nidogen-2 [Aix galericulata]|nr:Nidogen-2 [Aix galericulata]
MACVLGRGEPHILNTFQAAIAHDEEDTYAIFLYPEGGLQFLGTRPKESYNVQLELPARVGFSRGDSDDGRREGLFYSVASTEQALRRLERGSNAGVPGVWVFHVGSSGPLEHVEPGGKEGASPGTPQSPAAPTEPPARPGWAPTSPRPHHHGQLSIIPVGLPASPGQERSRRLQPDGDTPQSHPANPASYSSGQHGVGVEEDVHFNTDVFTYSAGSKETCARHHGRCSPHAFCTDYATGLCCHCQASYYGNGRQCLPEGTGTRGGEGARCPGMGKEGARAVFSPRPGAVHRLNGKVSGSLVVGRTPVRFQDVDLHAYIVGSDGRAYTAVSGVPAPAARALLPLLPLGGLFGWLFALEEPGYENGFSITGERGRGSEMLPSGSGSLSPPRCVAGSLGSAAGLGRAPGDVLPEAIPAQVPPVPSSCPGAEFTQHLQVTFYPGEEQVHITQTAEGLGPDNYLSLKTHIQGQVPFIPENSTVHVGPYKELYHYSSSAVMSSAHRDYVLTSGASNQTLSYRLHQNITFSGCPHARGRLPPLQRLSVPRAFALYDAQEQALRYALAGRIGSAHGEHAPPAVPDDAERPPANPCHDGTHMCEATARCQPGTGLGYTCECADGYRGDGRGCQDVDECEEGLSQCGPFSVCLNAPGSYRCECRSGYRLAEDGHACVPPLKPQIPAALADPCEDGSHPCAPGDRARCLPRAGGLPACECLPGYTGDGRVCTDVDECAENPCHPAAACHNSPGSFSCHCQPGYEGDGFQCAHAQGSTQRLTPCEHERLYPRVPGHAAQCDERGGYRPLQCHGGTGHCWCVDAAGQEIAGTRTAPGSTPPRCGDPGHPAHGVTVLVAIGVPPASSRGERGCGGDNPEPPGASRAPPEPHQHPHPRVPGCSKLPPHDPGARGVGVSPPAGSSQQLTPCEHERLYPRAVPPGPSPVGDGHVPQCDERGGYRPLQCHGSTGHCWCVDAAGQEIAGTRTAPGSTPPRCGDPGWRSAQRGPGSVARGLTGSFPVPEPTERPPSMCERWRQSLLEHYGGSPRGDQYVPQCEAGGHFTPLQCHGDSGYCWCVDESGREIQGTRSEPGSPPPCKRRALRLCNPPRAALSGRRGEARTLVEPPPTLFPPLPPRSVPGLPSVAPPSARPSPRPDVSPPGTGTFLLYAQGQQIGYLPLNGTRLQKEAAKTLLSLHVKYRGRSGWAWRSRRVSDPSGRGCAPAAAGLRAPAAGGAKNPVGVFPQEKGLRAKGHLVGDPGRLPRISPRPLQPHQGSIVVGIDYDCRERTVYWTDVAGRTINRASLEPGTEPETVISSGVSPAPASPPPQRHLGVPAVALGLSSFGVLHPPALFGAGSHTSPPAGLLSPEGLAVDHLRRAMFWTDSGLDKIERARLDGSERRVLFDTELVNPRAIAVDPVRGQPALSSSPCGRVPCLINRVNYSPSNLYWTDWNREAPKIETATVNGANRRVLVSKDIGLPNGLTFDPFSKLLCWADAGTKNLECTFPDGAGRRIIQNSLNYPFSIISYADHFYHTDWRRDGVIAVNKETGSFTDEYLPEHRSHLYGITAVYPYCPGARK